MSDWAGRTALVTGAASFIGSTLVDALLARGAKVKGIDDLSSGIIENLEQPIREGTIDWYQADLRQPGLLPMILRDVDTVFHLAADHGGRGYVDTYQAGPASNLYLDGLVCWEAVQAKVERIVFASSGCIYPCHLQGNPDEILYLTEEMAGPPYDADNMYGWAKLMTELTLQSYHQEFGVKTASCRYFTVYGPRAKENHAVIAMLAKAFVKQDPFEVWGTGEQIRNWTYVDDIVEGTIRAAECIQDGTAINLGTMERIRVLDAVKMAMDLMDHDAEIITKPDMPTGPLNRVASNAKAKELLNWEPQVLFEDGIRKTYDWYVKNRTVDQVKQILDLGGLIERKVETK